MIGQAAKRTLPLILVVLALAAVPRAGAAQGLPYTLDQVITLLGGLDEDQILDLVRGDCISFRVEGEAERRLRESGASDSFITALRSVCYRGPEAETRRATPPATATAASVPRVYSPGSAAVRSAIVPGLGQFYTGRPLLGTAFLAAAGGALAAGFLSEKVTVECLARTSGACPHGQIRDESVERPYLAAGIGAFAALAVIGAVEAHAAARKANARFGLRGEADVPGSGLRIAGPGIAPTSTGVEFHALRIRF
ncbi:MAG TPA: hypothetical protein VKZ58_05865 [Longimicrobiales bacterium]|nr:hypothetical protein [Longimicrobiales bacterium]